jgi:hypothetical protein
MKLIVYAATLQGGGGVSFGAYKEFDNWREVNAERRRLFGLGQKSFTYDENGMMVAEGWHKSG